MTAHETRAELERIDRACPVGKDDRTLCELLDEANDVWIPGSNAIEMFRLLAESQQALRKINGLLQHQLDNEDSGDLITILQLLDALMIIAKTAYKGGSNG